MKLERPTYYMWRNKFVCARICNGTDMNQIRMFVAPLEQGPANGWGSCTWACKDCIRNNACDCKDDKRRFIATLPDRYNNLNEITEKEATTKGI